MCITIIIIIITTTTTLSRTAYVITKEVKTLIFLFLLIIKEIFLITLHLLKSGQ